MLSRVLLCRLLLFYGIDYYPGPHYHRPGYSPLQLMHWCDAAVATLHGSLTLSSLQLLMMTRMRHNSQFHPFLPHTLQHPLLPLSLTLISSAYSDTVA